MKKLGPCGALLALSGALFAMAAGAAEGASLSVAEALARGPSEAAVQVSAWAVRSELMDDPMDRYAAETRYNDPSSSGKRLGYRGAEGALAALPAAEAAVAQRVTLTGRVKRCGEGEGAGGGDGNLLAVVDAADFCAQHRGLYLDVAAMQAGESQPLVRGLAVDHAGQGNLLPLAAHSPVRAAVIAWFREAYGPLEQLVANPVVELFGWRKPLWADGAVEAAWQQQSAAAPEAILCVMEREKADQGLWPISTKDIGNAKGRPYLCAQIMSTGGQRRAVFAEDPSPAMEPR